MKHTSSLASLCLALSACTYSGLPGDVPLSELTEEQSQQLCTATDAYVDSSLSAQDRKTFSCNLAGSIAGAFVGEDAYTETCTEARQNCLDDDDQGGEEETSEESNCENAGVSNCTATVEQYEACTREIVDTIKESNASFSCEDGPGTEEEGDEEETACEAYQKTCGGE
ncbi:MAG: hypothetical protein ACO3JL_01295 [Myxococcota bacterium]